MGYIPHPGFLRGVVNTPGDLPVSGSDGESWVVRNHAGAGSPPSIVYWDGPTSKWIDITDPDINSYRTTAVSGPILATDDIIGGIGGAAGITLTLPSAVGMLGKQYLIKKIDVGVGPVTIAPVLAETIEGAGLYVLPRQWDGVMLMSDNSNWLVLATIP